MPGVFDLLDRKQRHRTVFHFPLRPEGEVEAARDAVRRARLAAFGREDGQGDVDAAQQALDECFARVEFLNMPPAQFDLLMTQSAEQTDEQRKAAAWTADDLRLHVVAGSVADDGARDVARWAEIVNRPEWSSADRLALYAAALEANTEQPSAGLGKG